MSETVAAQIEQYGSAVVVPNSSQLKSIVERIETLETSKREISDDIKDVYAEAKSNGFDTAVLRQVVKLRRLDAAEREENESLLEVYCLALGMIRRDE